MLSTSLRRTALGSLPPISCRLISSLPTAVRKSKAEEAQTPLTGTRNVEANIPQSNPKYDATSSRALPSAAAPSTQPPSDQPFPAPYQHTHLPHRRSPLTNWILASPQRTAILLKLGDWLGYGSPKQVAGRRSKIIYNVCSEVALGHERHFWYDTLSLPPSFQSWFTITNVHVWLATVRLRALPPSHGRPFIQALIDHFFLDVEDRLRAVLGKKAPERLVTRHMKIFRDQWAGLGIACDIALLTGDKDMASAMWRNLLGARGARGITYPEGTTPSISTDLSEDLFTTNSTSSQSSMKIDDPSSGGVTDFEGPAIDKYVLYPQLMLILTSYLRRELVRLEKVSNAVILGGEGRGLRESVLGSGAGVAAGDLAEAFKFGRVKDAARKIGTHVDGL